MGSLKMLRFLSHQAFSQVILWSIRGMYTFIYTLHIYVSDTVQGSQRHDTLV